MDTSAHGGSVPVWSNNNEAGTYTHFQGNPSGGIYQVPLSISSTPPTLLFHSWNFSPNPGNTNASAGLQHTQTSTKASVTIPAGTGVSQTDPNHVQAASSLDIYYNAQWTIESSNFGVPISGSFSLPIGAKIGSNGSASATVTLDWIYINLSNQAFLLAPEYHQTQTWLGGPSGQTIVTSFTAPTYSFSPNTLVPGEILAMVCDVTFAADNNNGPTLIEIPTLNDFSAFGVKADEQSESSTYIPNFPTWNNAGAGSPTDGVTWDTNTTQNFNNNGVPGAVFNDGDYVTFNDSNNGHYNVSINSVVTPGDISVSNSTGNYRFGGTGSIGGGALLTKSGTASLTLSTSNTYAGGTTLVAGTLNINNASALGVGTFNIAGGTIDNTGPTAITLVNNNAQIWSGNFNFGGTNALNLGTGPVTLATNVVISTGGSAVLTEGGTIGGPFGVTKTGFGTLLLTGANTYTGLTQVNGGTLQFASTSTTGIGYTGLAGGLNISSSAVVKVATAPSHSTRLLLTLGSLGFASTIGSLDLANNDMDIQTGSLTTLIGQLKLGYNNGTWNGAGGVTSSFAAADTTHITTLGIIQNTSDGVNPLYSSSTGLGQFDGTSPSATDLLVKYTYYGDANLDGKVDGTDYSRIDAGLLASATTWFNGDFNYDQVVNGSDYTLIDNAYNSQGTSLAAIFAGPAAAVTSQIGGTSVPEPSAIGIICMAGIGLLSRRKRPA